MLSRPWPRRLTPDRARPWFGEPPPRHLTSCYDRLRQALRRPLELGQAALVVLRSRYSDDEIHVGMPAAAALKQRRWRLIIDGIVETPMLRACVDAVELARSPKNVSSSYYRPIRFAPADKVGKSDKLLLAFDALALSRVTGMVPPTGRIIHGHRYARTTPPLPQPIREVRSALAKIAALRARTAPPPPVLNKHCTECEFRSRCRADA